MKKIEVDDNIFIGEEIDISDDMIIGHNNLFMSYHITIGSHVSIGSNNKVLVGEFFLVQNTTHIGNCNLIEGRSAKIGANVWWGDENVVGHGGKWGVNSDFELGSFSMAVGKCIFNLSDKITIGEHVGIGGEVNIWTHGGYLPILRGFPAQYGPVTVGNYVWLPARSIVLPNVTVGSNVVIGINSLVNMNIPDGCFAAGIPIRIINENCYPKVDDDALERQIRGVIQDYEQLCHYKAISVDISYMPEQHIILCNGKSFDLKTMEFSDKLSEEEEDFRDYLRRRGVKFFGSRPFKGILPPNIRSLQEFYKRNQ
jgi:acetyltransferase-like isoleucine patch superfamily enzyme